MVNMRQIALQMATLVLVGCQPVSGDVSNNPAQQRCRVKFEKPIQAGSRVRRHHSR